MTAGIWNGKASNPMSSAERTNQYVTIIEHYINQLTPQGANDETKARIRLLVTRLGRDVVHWTNGYNEQVREQADKLLDEQGL